MDLRRIVEEVEEKRRAHYAMAPPPCPRPQSAQAGGVTASILETVRERMLREDPRADVSGINAIIEPDASTPPPKAPRASLSAEPVALAIARQAARNERATAGKPAASAGRGRAARDDFLSRYLVMSEEFEKRYKLKGWTDLVRKKCSSELRR